MSKVKLPYFIYDFYDFFFYFEKLFSSRQCNTNLCACRTLIHFIYTYHLLAAFCPEVCLHACVCACVHIVLRKIRFNVIHALCKESLSHVALGAGRVELLGALLHRMDAHTDGHVQRERVALLLNEFNIRQMQRKACCVLCSCK